MFHKSWFMETFAKKGCLRDCFLLYFKAALFCRNIRVSLWSISNETKHNFSRLFAYFLYNLLQEISIETIWKGVGSLKLIQRDLWKKGLVSRVFFKNTFWNNPFLQIVSLNQPLLKFIKKKRNYKNCIQHKVKISCEQFRGLVTTDKECKVHPLT